MTIFAKRFRKRVSRLGAASFFSLTIGFAQAQDIGQKAIEIAAQPLQTALLAFSAQTDIVVVAPASLTEGKTAPQVSGDMVPTEALDQLLSGSGLRYERGPAGEITIKLVQRESRNAADTVRVAQADSASDANDAPDKDERNKLKRDEIIVTGTNIRGVAPASSPSFVFERDDIDKTGFGTVSEFVQSLPQNFGGGSNADTARGVPTDRNAGSNIAFGSSVNLRGLGSGSTLVLLNGSRLAPAGQIGDFVDISMIPLSAVERVEVLTDGASAIYGADAIAGVVNFVLRDDYDGADSFVRFGSATEGDLNEYRAGQTFGESWGSGNALLSYEFYNRDNLGTEDRSFSSATVLPNDLLPEQKSHSVLLTASQQLNDRVTLRGHGTFSQRDASSVNTGISNGLTTFFQARTKQYGGFAGTEIELWGDWLLDLSGSYHKVNSFTDIAAANMTQQEIESDIWSVNGKVDGTLFRLPGGDAKIAAGLNYREESFLFARPDIGDINAQDDRNAFAAFGEAFIPIVGANNRVLGVERLEVTAAVRYDDYSDFGDTFNPKVGVLWSPLDGLNFRGTYSTSFNPPNLGDTGTTAMGSLFAVPAPNPASPTGTSLALLDFRTNRDLTPETSTAWTAGLDYSQDVGSGDLDLSVTWFDISYENRIGNAGAAFFFLTNPVVFADAIITDPDPAVTAAIIADAVANGGGLFDFSGGAWTMPGDEEFILDNRLLNLATADTSGLDVNLAYNVDTEIGQLNFGLNGSYLFKQKKGITPTSPVFDVVSTVFNPVDLRLRGSSSWSRDGLNASVFVNYTDSYVDDRNLQGMGNMRVDSWTTVDVNLSYDTQERMGNSWLDNVKFSLSVLNLFNQDPPSIEFVPFGSPTGFDSTNASPLGRFISFQVTKLW